jgi:hypothetical protein
MNNKLYITLAELKLKKELTQTEIKTLAYWELVRFRGEDK